MLKLHGYTFLRHGKGSHETWTNGVHHQKHEAKRNAGFWGAMQPCG